MRLRPMVKNSVQTLLLSVTENVGLLLLNISVFMGYMFMVWSADLFVSAYSVQVAPSRKEW